MRRFLKPESSTVGKSQPILLTAQQAAEFLGVSVRFVYKLMNSGRMPRPIRLGRALRFRREELNAWVSAGAPPRHEWEARRQGDAKP